MNETKCLLGDATVVVRFEYEPEERGHGAHPDYPAYVEIQEVVIGGVAVAPQLLNEDWISDIEIAVMKQIGKDLQDAADERAWDRQEERLAEGGHL